MQSLGFQRALLFVALMTGWGVGAMQAEVRLWTSTVGSTIEAEYVATINGQHWLRENTGRLIKVGTAQLAETDRAILDKDVERGLALVADQIDPDVVTTLETLATTEIPTYHVNDLALQASLDRLSDAMALAAPDQLRVSFDAGSLGERVEVSLFLRKRSALGVLAFICRAHALELTGRVVGGRMEMVRRVGPVGRFVSVEASSQPQAPQASPGLVVGQEPPSSASIQHARQTAPVCTAAANQENFLKEPGFEQATSRWALVNRKSSFRRISSSEFSAGNYRPVLETMVMMVKATPYDGNRHEGPPYITQEIHFPIGTRNVRICCDLSYAGDITREEKVRLSITNADVHYVQGGKTFPFTWVSPVKPEQWEHMEFVVDVSEMGSRRLVVGFMFPFSIEPWYLDNTKVTLVAR